MSDYTSTKDDTSVAGLISRRVYQAAKNIYYLFFRTLLYVRCVIHDAFDAVFKSPHSEVPPALLRYKVSESLDISLFLDVGQRIAARIDKALIDVGTSFSHMNNVLDFGCGCGRTMRWLTARFPHTRFWGTDVDALSIQWCQDNLRGTFCTNRATPPLELADGVFDCVYAISVFTHIDEQHQFQWLAEFRRILRPGGLLLVSLHGMGTMDQLSPQEAATLRAQGILFKRSSKLRGIHPGFYHTSFQTKEYVMQTWSAFFEIVAYKELGLGYQDLVLLRRA